ncbi:MAG: efflux RND transporter periplasmic adaptor subunit [Boseongicola sp.]|nr:efflux RND transporter periplasmic adaptor subunit [Boseongicola sp.]
MSKPETTGLLKRAMRWVVSSTLTLVVVAAAVAAVMFGAAALANRSSDVPLPEAAATTKVAVATLERQQSYRVARRFVGQVEARATVDLSFELGGRLVSLLVNEGDEVAAGEVVASLDTALLEAEETRQRAARAATSTQLDLAETRLRRAEALREEGFASVETLDQALATRNELESRLAEIDASLKSVTINLEKSVMRAPFQGRVGAQFVDEGTALGASQSVASLIETGVAEVRVGLPLGLSPENFKVAEIEVAGVMYPAELIQFRPDIDPLTRTQTALFAIETETPPVFGQTATLVLQTEVSEIGVWVNLDALQEGAGGVWTVLVVEDSVVRSAAVEVLHAEETRVFVRGSFENGAQMIRSGAHRVVPGQIVDTMYAEG